MASFTFSTHALCPSDLETPAGRGANDFSEMTVRAGLLKAVRADGSRHFSVAHDSMNASNIRLTLGLLCIEAKNVNNLGELNNDDIVNGVALANRVSCCVAGCRTDSRRDEAKLAEYKNTARLCRPLLGSTTTTSWHQSPRPQQPALNVVGGEGFEPPADFRGFRGVGGEAAQKAAQSPTRASEWNPNGDQG
jgi:hypothetical protein